MIRGPKALREAFARGETVALQPVYEGRGFRLATTLNNEAVYERALRKLQDSGEAVVIHTDIAGEPMQWGPA